jgi:hypothetical protein
MDANEKKAVDEMIASFDSKIMFANSCPLDNDQLYRSRFIFAYFIFYCIFLLT